MTLLCRSTDGKRERGDPAGDPIVQVARNATFHHVLGGPDHATGVIRERSGRAFDPVVATALADAGLHRAVRPNRPGVAGPALLGVSGVGLLLAAGVPCARTRTASRTTQAVTSSPV
jgi:hypothetical protein